MSSERLAPLGKALQVSSLPDCFRCCFYLGPGSPQAIIIGVRGRAEPLGKASDTSDIFKMKENVCCPMWPECTPVTGEALGRCRIMKEYAVLSGFQGSVPSVLSELPGMPTQEGSDKSNSSQNGEEHLSRPGQTSL